MEVGDWDLAEFVAAQMLDHDAAYGGSHFTSARILRHRGNAAGALREGRSSRDATGTTRIGDLPELKQVEVMLSSR